MSGLYGFASRLSGCMAGLCAVLSLLALPSRSQADTLSDCQACCQGKGFVDQQLSECVGYCMQGSGPCAVAVTACSGAACQSPTGACTTACNQQSCNEGGKNPATAKCNSVTSGCRCV